MEDFDLSQFDLEKLEKQKSALDRIKDVPTDLLFYISSKRVMDEYAGMHVAQKLEINDQLDDLNKVVKYQLMREPEVVREAVGITIIDLEESDPKGLS